VHRPHPACRHTPAWFKHHAGNSIDSQHTKLASMPLAAVHAACCKHKPPTGQPTLLLPGCHQLLLT
jgi:hypothetical protein